MACHYHTVVYDVAKEVNYLPLCVLSNRIINENSIDDGRKDECLSENEEHGIAL